MVLNQTALSRRMLVKRIALLTGAAALPMASTFVLAASSKNKVLATKLFNYDDYSKYTIDLTGLVEHSIFTLDNPNRLVIDIKDVTNTSKISNNLAKNPLVKKIRFAARNNKDLRIVLDLSPKVISPSSVIKRISGSGKKAIYRLEINVKTHHYVVAQKKAKARKKVAKKQKLRDVVIAIDAGHGGSDPGAVGRRGTKEKDVTLALAKQLKITMNKQKGMRVKLMRTSDKFMDLRTRMNKARKIQADLFISLHADSFRNSRASGSSVYALSTRGATSEAAKLLAQKENAVDLFGKVSLNDKDDMLASVLLDMSQDSTIQASLDVGEHVLKSLSTVGRVHKKSVQQAGFVVLKSPDIPSILIESAFISNLKEEKKLKSKYHQRRLAKAVTKGVKYFFKEQSLPGTYLAS
jgi:N-acetylmuramoyl-L-alanine amidase